MFGIVFLLFKIFASKIIKDYNYGIRGDIMMKKIEAIKHRHSIRQYTDAPIEEEKLSEIEHEISICNKLSGLHMQLVTNDSEAFDGFMAHYGHFKNVRNYVALVGVDDGHLEEKVGYYGERVLIAIEELGLNTCWVALTYSKRKTHVKIGDHEKLVCVIAFGYGAESGQQHRYRPIEKVAVMTPEDPDWYRHGVELARLAPTAMNQQKYLIQRSGNVVKISAGVGFYTKVDVGIVRYHFEVGAGKENFKWFGEEEFMQQIHPDADEGPKNVLIISSSPRKGGNSDTLCNEFARGARESGHVVEVVRLADKKIGYCQGCFACAQTHKCFQKDDMDELCEKMLRANVIVFSSPVYFYNMTAQLKTFIDRLMPVYDKIRADIYLIATATDTDHNNIRNALEAIRGLTHDCLEGCEEKGRIVAGGVSRAGDIENRQELKLAYQMGRNI